MESIQRRIMISTLLFISYVSLSSSLLTPPSLRCKRTSSLYTSVYLNQPWGSTCGYHRTCRTNGCCHSLGGAIKSSSSSYKKQMLQMAFDTNDDEVVDVCIIGGGVSGLAAAKHAATTSINTNQENNNNKVLLLESTPTFGGRVQTDKTPDGYSLDRGFAVFIDAYPQLQKANLNKDTLHLASFEPGALVVLDEGDNNNQRDESSSTTAKIARVADPIRRPKRILQALTSPVGTFLDTLRLFPLLYYIRTKTVEQIFDENNNDNINNKEGVATDTKTCLKQKYGFSDEFIDQFFAPFFEGIFFCPLEEQSSNMFHFVFKMFNVGSATLPKGGIGSVTTKLVEDARRAGNDVELKVNSTVSKIVVVNSIEKGEKSDKSHFVVEMKDENKRIRTKSVILATEETAARKILSQSIDDFKTILAGSGDKQKDSSSQRSVGAVYFGFDTELPISEPILIINGMNGSSSSDKDGDNQRRHPINSVCFPSAVVDGYAPEGCHLCCVSIPGDVMEEYRGRHDALENIVRTKLKLWFPDYAKDIQNRWDCKGVYHIEKAQPLQLNVPYPATVHGGRDCKTFMGRSLPDGLFICGDHVATATLNGALESGVKAGTEAANFVFKNKNI